jgi:squalene-associated FAD-dependent desaturase
MTSGPTGAPPSMTDLVVVGGGLAGIAAALAAADAGARVTLLEARPRLGGATFSFQRDGLELDNGQHVYLRCCTAYQSLLSRLGVRELAPVQRRLAVPVLAPGGRMGWLRRNAMPAPLHLAGTLARYPYLGWGERLGAVRAALALRRLDPGDQLLDRRSFADWLADHGQGRAATDALWELVGLPTLNARTTQASLQLATMVFKTGLLTARDAADIGYSRVPLSRLHGEPAGRALAEAGAEVRLRSAVRAVEPVAHPDRDPGLGPADERAQGGAARRLAVVTEDGRVEASTVIVAVPHEAAGWLPEAVAGDGGPARWAERLGTSPIVNLHVVYDRAVTTLPFAAGLGTPVQWVFDRTESSGLEPGAGQCLAVSLSAAADEVELPVAELRARFLPALAELFPAARQARVDKFVVTRERTATFLPSPGTGAIRPSAQTNMDGLFLAGSWTSTGWPATMEGAVRSGLIAARAALLSLGRTRRLPTPEGFWGFPGAARRHFPRNASAVNRGGGPIRPEVAA